jgi:hypothetical protein
VVHLESRAIDDALELLDLLMATELLGKAGRDSGKDKVRRHRRIDTLDPPGRAGSVRHLCTAALGAARSR